MKTRVIRVTAPCRLHFGLLSFNNPNEIPFGGLGVMIDSPRLEIEASAWNEFHVNGPLQNRIHEFARTWQRFYGFPNLPRCKIDVLGCPRQHTGLGVGTQLGLSVATLLNHAVHQNVRDLAELCQSVQRGKRSSIGTLGFQFGGLIFEGGKTAEHELPKESQRTALPKEWRIVLIHLSHAIGLSGKREQLAFESLPMVPKTTTEQLKRLATHHVFPAARENCFQDFCHAIRQYGEMAGGCFADLQGGPYASLQLQNVVDFLMKNDITGVGQSSWGPTLFAFQPNHEIAKHTVQLLRNYFKENKQDASMDVTAASERGANVATFE